LICRFGGYHSLCDEQVLSGLVDAACYIADAAEAGARVVFSGAGTSGRLCWMACELLNELFKERQEQGQWKGKRFEAWCSLAGGNRAFKKAVEHAEDDSTSAVAALEGILDTAATKASSSSSSSSGGAKSPPLVLVGVSCGMSATWVASQVLHCLKLGGKVILLGFTPFEGCRGLFAEPDVYQHILSEKEAGNVIILEPIVGPELVTGSTRLKSGTATKICLEALICLALGFQASGETKKNKTKKSELLREARSLVTDYTKTLRGVYRHRKGCADVAHSLVTGGNSLRRNGRIVYGGYGREGMLGIIDASEQLPTFGCLEQDFQGFLLDEEVAPGIKEVIGEERCLPAFEKNLLTLTEKDTLALIWNWEKLSRSTDLLESLSKTLKKVDSAKAEQNFSLIVFCASDPECSSLEEWKISHNKALTPAYWDHLLVEESTLFQNSSSTLASKFALNGEIALKSALNCFSNGSNVLNGKVYGNRMIDVRLSNKKLVERAIQIVTTVSEKPRENATRAILKVLLDPESASNEEKQRISNFWREVSDLDTTPLDECVAKTVEDLVALASNKRKVVPTSVLLATSNYTLEEAKEALKNSEKSISELVHNALH
jgi:N-acetylmuramic acid 6-phosphate (MurNAc-6-P) etherase